MCGDSYWGIPDVIVACRQLRLPTTGATGITVNGIPDTSRVSWLANVVCVGNESSLFNCNVLASEINCYKFEYAGVSCRDSKS